MPSRRSFHQFIDKKQRTDSRTLQQDGKKLINMHTQQARRRA